MGAKKSRVFIICDQGEFDQIISKHLPDPDNYEIFCFYKHELSILELMKHGPDLILFEDYKIQSQSVALLS